MIRLYPVVKVQGQSYENVKKCVVPNQSMSLQEILRRFVKCEQLPVAREGVYEERFGDLEKMSKADITVQMEEVERIKADIAAFELQYQQRKAKIKADMDAAARQSFEESVMSRVPKEPIPGGVSPVKSPPPQGA